MNAPKTHYRKVFKSDHLGVADLEDLLEQGSDLIFTIAYVKQEYGIRVAGRKGDHNIAYFREDIKPMVVNATNSTTLKNKAQSIFVEDWKDMTVRLYIEPKFKFGENDAGVGIDPNWKKVEKKELTPDMDKLWANAIAAYKRDGNLEKVLARMDISEENQIRIKEEGNQ